MAKRQQEMSLAAKVGLGFGLIGLVLISTVVMTIIKIQNVSQTNHQLSNSHNPALLASLHIISGLNRSHTLLQKHKAGMNTQAQLNKIWAEDIDPYFPTLVTYDAKHPTNAQQLSRDLKKQLDKQRRHQKKLINLVNEQKPVAEQQVLKAAIFASNQQIEKNLYRHFANIEVKVTRDSSLIQKTLEGLLDANWLLLTIGLTLCGLFAIILTRSVQKPIGQVVAVADDIAQGKLTNKIHITGAREFELLSEKLERMVARLKNVAQVTDAMSNGNYQQRIEPRGKADVLAVSVNQMLVNFNEIVTQTNAIAEGDYSKNIEPRSSEDTLGNSLQNMTLKLRQNQWDQEAERWLKDGINQLASIIANKNTLKTLGFVAINHVARYLNANMGAIYQHDEKAKLLKLAGSFSYNQKIAIKQFALGEGSIGQVALDQTKLHQTFAEDSALAHSVSCSYAMSESRGIHLYTLPLLHEKKTVGVIELVLNHELTELQNQFLEHTLTMISSHFFNIQQHMLTLSLLNQAKALSAELTEQKEQLHSSNQKLEMASQYKSEFLASMSHELRTPLNSILVLAKMLANNDEGTLSKTQVKSAKVILKSGRDLLALINDILDLAKVEAGKLAINMGNIAIDNFKEYMYDTFQPIAKEKDLVFSVHRDPNVPELMHSDEHRLSQIIKNLLSNALKFTKDGSVSLEIKRPENKTTFKNPKLNLNNSLAFVVTDTGIGIPTSKQKMVFEAFQQADAGDAKNYGGTGLGLSISAQLASMLGGEISISSAENQGSTFTLYLPIGNVDQTEAPIPQTTPHSAQAPTSEPETAVPNLTKESFIIDSSETSCKALQDKRLCVLGKDMRLNFSIAKYFKNQQVHCDVSSNLETLKSLTAENTPLDCLMIDGDTLELDEDLVQFLSQSSLKVLGINIKNSQAHTDIITMNLTWPLTQLALVDSLSQALAPGETTQ